MTREMLLRMSRLAAGDPFYLGWHLSQYLEMKDMSAEEMGKELGCLPDTVNSISLCRAPREEPHHYFRSDIERVADRFQVSATKLMEIVRYVQVASDESRVIAARDRDEEEDGNPEPDE